MVGVGKGAKMMEGRGSRAMRRVSDETRRATDALVALWLCR